MRRVPALVLAATLAFAAMVTMAGPAHAIDFTVNSTADSPDANPGDKICASTLDGKCTLRAAVMEVDALGKTSNNITIPAGIYTLSLSGADEDWGYTGDLDLRVTVNFKGTTGSTSIVGGPGFGDRIIDIPAGTSPAVYMTGVTIQNGAAPATTHENGGGIQDLGGASLIIQNVEIDNSTALGGSGGGLYASGPAGSTLTVNGSTGLTLTGNTASANGGGLDVEGATVASVKTITASTNAAANGGGLSAFLEAGATGSMDVTFSTFSGNTAATGGGGGMAVERSTIAQLTVSGNTALLGGGIELLPSSIPSVIYGRVTVSGNTATSEGGGIYSGGCGVTCTAIDLEVDSNTATLDGGGMYVSGGYAISGATFYRNVTGTSGLAGGAVFHTGPSGQPLSMTNVTITENTGGPTTSGFATNSASADSLLNVTIAANTGGTVKGIAVTGSGVAPQLKNTIVASSDPVNCLANVTSLGHNLDSGNTCGFTQPGDIVNKDPLLASWADTGGFTKTMRPAGGSPVIDAGDNNGCPFTDQRVVTRPQDGDNNGSFVCDIGAYELSQYTRNSAIQAIETASPTLVAPGSNVTYTTVLTNTGGDPLDAINTTLTDDLPSTLSIVSCGSTGNGACGPLSSHQTVTFPTFSLGATATVTIVAQVLPATGTSTRIDNTVRVSSDNPDLWAYDNTSTASVRVSVLPSISVSDASVLEGNSGTTQAAFTVSLSAPSDSTVTVNYSTADGTATSGSDYVSVPTTPLTFSPGQTSKTVNVTVNGDVAYEGNETFLVKLATPVNATIADSQGTGTIIDEEGGISFYVSDTQVLEGNSGTTLEAFTVSASSAPVTGQTVSVKYSTANGTATAGSDYVAIPSTTLTFAAGQTFKTVNVTVNGDTIVEPNETFFLNLATPKGGAIADTKGTATIINDDGTIVMPPPSLYVTDATVLEGDTGTVGATFTVSLAPASTSTVTVKYSTADSTATAGSDYVAIPSTTLTFAPGQTSQSVTVTVNGDVAHEGPEKFLLKLATPSGATIADNQGTGTITDNESAISFSVGDLAVLEGNTGTTTGTFTVTVSSAAVTGQTVSVKCATADGTATAGSDYVAIPLTTLTFPPGQTSLTVTVTVNGDVLVEGTETFFLNLSAPIGGSVADTQATATIVDDD